MTIPINFVVIALNINLNNMDMISVIIPTHNRPLFLQRALKSVLQQMFINEIIIVDDSTASNKKKNQQLLGQYLIKYVSVESKGASFSRNIGAVHAKGKYLAFLDDDDYWLGSYLENCYNLAEENKSDIVLTGFLEEKEGLITNEKMPPPDLTKNDFLIKNPGLRGSNLFISKKMYAIINGFDENLASHNDLDLGYRIFRYLKLKYKCNEKYLVVFNNHEGKRLSTLGSYPKKLGLQGFWGKYENIMTKEQRIKYREKANLFWKIEL